MRKYILILLAIILIFTSCEKAPEGELVGDPLKFIEDYITSSVPGTHFVNTGFNETHEVFITVFLHDYVDWYSFGEKAWTALDAAKLAAYKAGCDIHYLKVSLYNESENTFLSWTTFDLKKGDLTIRCNNNYYNKGSYTIKRLSKVFSPNNKEAVLEEIESLKSIPEITTVE